MTSTPESTAQTPLQTLQPVADDKNLLNDASGSCCGGGCCGTQG